MNNWLFRIPPAVFMASAGFGQDASNTLQSTNFDNEKTFIANLDDASRSNAGHFYAVNEVLLSKKNPTIHTSSGLATFATFCLAKVSL
jgi:hypothetical protein